MDEGDPKRSHARRRGWLTLLHGLAAFRFPGRTLRMPSKACSAGCRTARDLLQAAALPGLAGALILGMSFGMAQADVVEQGPKDSTPSGLEAGVSRADITPPVGAAQMNWGSQTHVRAVGADPTGMKVTALVLSNAGRKFAMVDIDRLFVSGLEPAIERAAKLTGIPESNIRLAATHTHAGVYVNSSKGPPGLDLSPLIEMAERYRLQIIDKVVGAVVEADSRLQAAHMYGARGIGSININRRVRAHGNNPPAVGRNPAGFVDRELIVFRIDDARGGPLAVLVNYPCHGTVLAYENKLVSPDFAGTLRTTVEDAMPGSLCLFFQGAAGNQGPIEGFTGDLGVAHRLGRILGHEVAALALGIETVRREPTPEGFVESTAYQARQHWRVKGPRAAVLRFDERKVEVPRRMYSAEEIKGMDERLRRAERRLRLLGPAADPWRLHQAAARVRRFADLLAQRRKTADPSPLAIEVQALRIGDLAIVAMPGEPFAEIGRAVRKASPFALTMFCGYSDGLGGDYVPTPEEYAFGGYEVERTPYGPGAARKIIDDAVDLLRSLR